jgi:hypothetical protein
MNSDGGTAGHAGSDDGTHPLQMRLFDGTSDDPA